MMPSRSDHVDDGVLLRWIDGEASDLERRAMEVHLAECADCTRQLSALQAAAQSVHRVLTRVLDVEAPAATRLASPHRPVPARREQPHARASARRSPGRGWRIAASLVLLLGVLAAVPELRALVLDTWRALTVLGPSVEAVRTVPATSEPEMRSIVEVTPGDSFRVTFEAAQPAGSLTVSAHDSATAIILSSDPHTSVMVLPSRVRIANRGSRADYQIIVPPTLDYLGVGVAGRRLPSVTTGELRTAGRIVIPLQ